MPSRIKRTGLAGGREGINKINFEANQQMLFSSSNRYLLQYNACPLPATHAWTVILSLPVPPVTVWRDFVPCLLVKIKPLSSALNTHSGFSTVSKAGFRQFWNQSSISAASSDWALTSARGCGFRFTSCGCLFIKPAHQSNPRTPFLNLFWILLCLQYSVTTLTISFFPKPNFHLANRPHAITISSGVRTVGPPRLTGVMFFFFVILVLFWGFHWPLLHGKLTLSY